MDIFHINENQVVLNNPEPTISGFFWLDSTHDEVTADPEAWRAEVARITGTQIYDLHLQDAINLTHPSYFDATQEYEMVVFRKLALHGDPVAQSENDISPDDVADLLTEISPEPLDAFMAG